MMRPIEPVWNETRPSFVDACDLLHEIDNLRACVVGLMEDSDTVQRNTDLFYQSCHVHHLIKDITMEQGEA